MRKLFSLFVAILATTVLGAKNFRVGDLYYYAETPEVSTTGINGSKFWPIQVDQRIVTKNTRKRVADFRPNNEGRFCYVWDGTYIINENPIGSNFHGNNDSYLALLVGYSDWAGCGYTLTATDPDKSWEDAEALRADIVANPNDYYLHMAIKSTDEASHCFYIFGSEATKFVIGSTSVYDAPIYENFARNGNWTEFDIPMSRFATALSTITCAPGVNIFAALSENIAGAQLNLDAVYFYKKTDIDNDTTPNYATLTGAVDNLTSITIPETITYEGTTYSVTSIGSSAFSGCHSLTSITIPNSVTSIGKNAFSSCDSLISITIPNSVTSIGESAFENCFSLNSITIPNSITSIEKLVFGSCDSLTSITIPNSVTSIGEQAFYGCNTLTSITIPNSVTSIGERAFAVCPTLTSITIPNSVTSIGERALSECYFLKTNFINNSLLNAEENNYWGATFVDQDIDGLLIRNDTVIKCRRLASSITIPNTITRIEDVAFAYCGNLTFVSIPNSVTSVGDDIFLSCRSLTSIVWDITEWTNPKPKPRSPFPTSLTSLTLGNHVEQIPAYFCYEMKNLSMINIPNVTKSIGESAFYGCESLTSVTIPNSVTSIGENAFAGCSKLQDVYCYAVEPPTAYDSSFSQYNAFLYIPCENKKAYMLDEVFGNFKYIECISSDEVKTNDVVITPSTNDVTITWPTEGNADTYTIVIKQDDEVFCTLTFNADGQLLNIAFAPGRDGNHPVQYAEQAGNGYRFTVTGLEESTHYTYNIDVRDAADKTIKSYTGEFTTESLTAVENITTNNANNHKIIRDNQLLILRDGKTYTIMGAEIH